MLPFEFKVRLPKAKKARIIAERDISGKIITSKVPNYF